MIQFENFDMNNREDIIKLEYKLNAERIYGLISRRDIEKVSEKPNLDKIRLLSEQIDILFEYRKYLEEKAEILNIDLGGGI